MLVAAGAVAATLVVWGASASDVALWHDPPPADPAPAPDADLDPVEIDLPDRPLPEEPAEPGDPPDLSWVFQALLVVMAVAVVVLLVRNVRFGPRRSRAARRAIEPLPDVDLAEAIEEVAEDLHQRLARGTPRNAIVECWVLLEDAVAAAGPGRRPAETSAEFTARVIGEHSVDPLAIDRLAELYREARFSRHELVERHREEAIAALDALRAQLAAHAQAAVAEP